MEHVATRTLERTGFQAVDILGNQVPKQSTFSPRVILRYPEHIDSLGQWFPTTASRTTSYPCNTE